ncbi:unannotated protein [freshwater metagenome]|uniref:Unannotated protein n=1 Tax=freshwater metagenome TaxID=449393 RepID=A0A6J7D6F2_9ZZZZ
MAAFEHRSYKQSGQLCQGHYVDVDLVGHTVKVFASEGTNVTPPRIIDENVDGRLPDGGRKFLCSPGDREV